MSKRTLRGVGEAEARRLEAANIPIVGGEYLSIDAAGKRARQRKEAGRKRQHVSSPIVPDPAFWGELALEVAESSMNGSEERYARELELRLRAGDIYHWGFQVMKFRLAEGAWYTPDFWVVTARMRGEVHEVKGKHFREAGRVRLLAAASTHPWFRFYLARETRQGVFSCDEVPRAGGPLTPGPGNGQKEE